MQTRHSAGERGIAAAPILLLAIAAVSCSRLVFALFKDPEGPNLIMVGGLGFLILLVSSVAYFSRVFPTATGLKRGLGIIPLQLIVAAAVYFVLR